MSVLFINPFLLKVDRIYLSTPTKIAILDHERKRTFVLRKDGLPDAGEMRISNILSVQTNSEFIIILVELPWNLHT